MIDGLATTEPAGSLAVALGDPKARSVFERLRLVEASVETLGRRVAWLAVALIPPVWILVALAVADRYVR